MLNSGKWPQIFKETSPKSENAGTVHEKSWLVDGDRSGSLFFRLDFSGRVIARLPPAPCRKEWRRIEEIGCSVGFMQNCPADLHLAGFCGISADCAESGLDSPNFAFSQNSSVAQFEHFWGLQLSPSVFSLPIKNVPIIGCSTNAENAGHFYR